MSRSEILILPPQAARLRMLRRVGANRPGRHVVHMVRHAVYTPECRIIA